MNFSIFPRVVGDVLQSFKEFVEEEDIELIYSNTESYVDIYASEKYVAKVFQNLDEGRSRCYTEYVNHMTAYSKLPQHVLEMYYYLIDNTSSCLIYERGFDFCEIEVESNIESIVKIIENFNTLNVFHLDTKPTNFLINNNGEIVLHDWGLACVTKQFNKEYVDKIKLSQLRLLFIIWNSSEPKELLESLNARCIYNLPQDTMYTDEYFELLFSIQDYHKF
jgi:serine/threonine protein kinase